MSITRILLIPIGFCQHLKLNSLFYILDRKRLAKFSLTNYVKQLKRTWNSTTEKKTHKSKIP